jgi:GTPase SAR1 family protein
MEFLEFFGLCRPVCPILILGQEQSGKTTLFHILGDDMMTMQQQQLTFPRAQCQILFPHLILNLFELSESMDGG